MISLSVARWRIRLPETLPRLTGTGLRIFSIIWAAAIATALIVTVFGTWQSFKPYPYRWLNYGLSASSSGSEIFAVTGQQAQHPGSGPATKSSPSMVVPCALWISPSSAGCSTGPKAPSLR